MDPSGVNEVSETMGGKRRYAAINVSVLMLRVYETDAHPLIEHCLIAISSDTV